jgi:hypothetical protein
MPAVVLRYVDLFGQGAGTWSAPHIRRWSQVVTIVCAGADQGLTNG